MSNIRKGFVLWLTGLPASGKTTIARGLIGELKKRGQNVELLDGDWVRGTINVDAGFTKEERRKHLLRVAWIARLLARNGIAVLCSFVSPYREVRQEIRQIVEEEVPFIEVFVKCSIKEAIRRDTKGLYKKALKGEIKNVTGIDDPYEEPLNPEILINTETENLAKSISKILAKLEECGYLR